MAIYKIDEDSLNTTPTRYSISYPSLLNTDRPQPNNIVMRHNGIGLRLSKYNVNAKIMYSYNYNDVNFDHSTYEFGIDDKNAYKISFPPQFMNYLT